MDTAASQRRKGAHRAEKETDDGRMKDDEVALLVTPILATLVPLFVQRIDACSVKRIAYLPLSLNKFRRGSFSVSSTVEAMSMHRLSMTSVSWL